MEEEFPPERLVVEKEFTLEWPVVVRKNKIGTIKLGGPNFEVTKYNGCTDYLLWK